ncbi:hypothetical protein HYO99_gp18 [Roseobacter phage RD-1410W1-01]|uniref:Uncharacterized protein n=1 Tax=Roseobacter phage RD-1410W1-01 TaxID=1815984 RepID=A0A191VYF9_9CAUD|nr:hypothetical protein HYO99_gp18 [Roseobacter phage RD-1410W1-01]ANJ20752.1 hypothetical protein RDp01_gp18 [Roseobacter phage RD-1410W1-01]
MVLEMKLFFQSLIMGFSFGGVYGLSSEWGGPKDEPLFWMTFFVLGVIAFGLVRGYPELVTREVLAKRNQYDDEDHAKRVSRIKIIQGICNRNMATAEGRNKLPIKSHVVVPYEDMLRIWDNADKITYSE